MHSTCRRKDYPPLHKVIYLYECQQCRGRYVGKTSQWLGEPARSGAPHQCGSHKREGEVVCRRIRDNPTGGYHSAITCHLAGNKACCEQYSDADFKAMICERSAVSFVCFYGPSFWYFYLLITPFTKYHIPAEIPNVKKSAQKSDKPSPPPQTI